MAAKVQPSLTITQLGIGKIPGATTANTVGSGVGIQQQQQQQNLTANIQTLNASNSSGGNASPSITTVNASTGAQLVNVTQGANGGHLLTTQNVSSAGGATVVPVAITTRGGTGGNILTGTITPIKNANGITVGKVMAQAQVAAAASDGGQQQSTIVSAGSGVAPTSVFIHHAAVPQQRPHSGGSGAATVAVATSNVITSSVSGSSVNSVITAGNATGTAGAFLPAGSTFYYESVPASSVQVSTGVLSLNTTTVTNSTMSQSQQMVAGGNSASNLAITSLPFSHVPTSTATFTVVPSTGGRTIGQLQLPVSSGGSTQIQAVPVRFSAQLGPGNANSVAEGTHIAVAQPTQLVSGSGGQQILIPAPQQGTAGSQGPQHMVIPLQTSIKVTTGGGVAGAGSTVVSNFLRKRDADGSPVRAAKNLAPTFLSMNSNMAASNNTSAAAAQLTATTAAVVAASGGNVFNTNSISTVNVTPSSALIVESLTKKERSVVTAVVPSTRSSRAVSPASSDGSTTVSANSSPGIEQQIQDNNMVINRMTVGSNESTHFNPINEVPPL